MTGRIPGWPRRSGEDLVVELLLEFTLVGRPSLDKSEWEEHLKRVREEIKATLDRADELARILPSISDPESQRKIEQLVESYRLHATRLSEHVSCPGDL